LNENEEAENCREGANAASNMKELVERKWQKHRRSKCNGNVEAWNRGSNKIGEDANANTEEFNKREVMAKVPWGRRENLHRRVEQNNKVAKVLQGKANTMPNQAEMNKREEASKCCKEEVNAMANVEELKEKSVTGKKQSKTSVEKLNKREEGAKASH